MLSKIIPHKLFNNTTRTNKLKTIALASTSLISCDNKPKTNENKIELKKDLIILTNQIQALEKNLDKDDYAHYGIDSTVSNAQQSLKEIKQLSIQQKKTELNKIVAQLNQQKQEKGPFKSEILQFLLGVGLGLCACLLGIVCAWLYDKY